MCPHTYHHSGFMATPALGTQDVRFPRECSNCTGSERNIQRITMCPIYIYIYIWNKRSMEQKTI